MQDTTEESNGKINNPNLPYQSFPDLCPAATINSSYNNLLIARNKDSTWQPKIIMDIPTPLFIHQLFGSNPIGTNGVDIVKFLTKPSLATSLVLENDFSYPKGCTLYLDGYHGVVDTE